MKPEMKENSGKPNEKYGNVFRVKPRTKEFDQAYRLNTDTFGREEVDPKKIFATYLEKGANPGYQMVMTAEDMGDKVVSEASGSYITMQPKKDGTGWIEYTVTKKGLRTKGHGTRVVRKLEGEMVKEARKKKEKILGWAVHAEDQTLWPEALYDSVGFWEKMGYRKIGVYRCPHYEFNAKTGDHLYEPDPYAFMIKMKGNGKSVRKSTLIRMLESVRYYHVEGSTIEDFDLEGSEEDRNASYMNIKNYLNARFDDLIEEIRKGPEMVELNQK